MQLTTSNSTSNVYANTSIPHLVIDREVYAWLCSEDILSNKIRFIEVGAKKIELDDSATKRFDSGVAVQKLIEKNYSCAIPGVFIYPKSGLSYCFLPVIHFKPFYVFYNISAS